MKITIRRYKRNGVERDGWQVDISVALKNGLVHRERRRVRLNSKTAAKGWAEQRAAYLMTQGPEVEVKVVPTLEEFAPRFITEYARAERQKPSGIAGKESVLKNYLVPMLGPKPLNEITTEEVSILKAELAKPRPRGRKRKYKPQKMKTLRPGNPMQHSPYSPQGWPKAVQTWTPASSVTS